MDGYADALARFETTGGYAVSHDIEAVLAGLGLDAVDQSTPVAILSGGQKIRLGLARLLLIRPQFLLLDEPTNHLNIEALEWLESFLARYDGAVLIVSHDRMEAEIGGLSAHARRIERGTTHTCGNCACKTWITCTWTNYSVRPILQTVPNYAPHILGMALVVKEDVAFNPTNVGVA